jgi:hypothetical protein
MDFACRRYCYFHVGLLGSSDGGGVSKKNPGKTSRVSREIFIGHLGAPEKFCGTGKLRVTYFMHSSWIPGNIFMGFSSQWFPIL